MQHENEAYLVYDAQVGELKSNRESLEAKVSELENTLKSTEDVLQQQEDKMKTMVCVDSGNIHDIGNSACQVMEQTLLKVRN